MTMTMHKPLGACNFVLYYISYPIPFLTYTSANAKTIESFMSPLQLRLLFHAQKLPQNVTPAGNIIDLLRG